MLSEALLPPQSALWRIEDQSITGGEDSSRSINGREAQLPSRRSSMVTATSQTLPALTMPSAGEPPGTATVDAYIPTEDHYHATDESYTPYNPTSHTATGPAGEPSGAAAEARVRVRVRVRANPNPT